MEKVTGTYLITGGCGFIGSYIARDLLEEGANVIVYDLKIDQGIIEKIVSKEKLKNVIFVQGSVAETSDFFDTIKKYKVDSIIHLAYVLYPQSENNPSVSLQVNVIGTNNIFEAARYFGLRRVIWTSSVSVFGSLGEFYGDKVITEKEVMYRPTRLYGATKALLEFLAKLYHEKFGVDIIGFRLARIYGVGKLSGGGLEFTGLLEQAALDIPITIRDGDAKWTYAYVEDVARLIVKACQVSSTKTKLFSVGDGGIYNGWQLAEVIKRVNPKAQIKVEPGRGVYDFPIQDMTPLREELGFIPEYPLERGLREVFNYFRRQKGLPSL